MGKSSRRIPGSGGGSSDSAPKVLTLVLPIELLPPASDELRWKALRVHCKSFEPLCVPPPEGVVAWPPMGVPAVDLFAYARGDYKKLTPRFMFFRKVLLLLVGEDDMLHSVVNTGACTGRDVMQKWNEALDKVLVSAADNTTNSTEIALYRVLLEELATGRRIDQSRNRAVSAVKVSLFVFVAGLLAYCFGWMQPLLDGLGQSFDSADSASTSSIQDSRGDVSIGSGGSGSSGGGSGGVAPSADASLETSDPWGGQGWHDLDTQQG